MTLKPGLDEFKDGLSDLWPALVAAAPIGLLFGALAQSKGLSVLEVGLFSALVFAGGAQLAAIELWSTPIPFLALIASTFLINARYLLMSASFAPKVSHFSWPQRLVSFHVFADENWALAERRARTQRIAFAYFGGMGLLFLVNWTAFSVIGALVGPFLGDPRRFGADFAFIAIFIGLIAGFVGSRSSFLVVLASAAGATLAYIALGTPWHVLIGALCGIAAAAIAYGDKP
jgi:predicted branched-subunit amino acid permease